MELQTELNTHKSVQDATASGRTLGLMFELPREHTEGDGGE